MNFFKSFFGFKYWTLVGSIALCLPQTAFSSVHQVPESLQSRWDDTLNLDSLATWHGSKGEHWVLATAKGTHQIFWFDAFKGNQLGEFGTEGRASGELNYPNGIATVGNLVFIVERDNHRVQVFSLPEWESLGVFGDQQLIRPYGLTVIQKNSHEYTVYVSDNYRAEITPPKSEQLAQRVKQFDIKLKPKSLEATLTQTFGETEGAGVLFDVESIAADTEKGILYVADETANDIKIYNLDGSFSGRVLGKGFFSGEPEGIALYNCKDGSGYVILTDQNNSAEANQFHIFDRQTYRYLGSFFGPSTTNTDGVVLDQAKTSGFPEGVIYVLHNDGGISGFDWSALSGALGLKLKCTTQLTDLLSH
jgi:3-phytase